MLHCAIILCTGDETWAVRFFKHVVWETVTWILQPV